MGDHGPCDELAFSNDKYSPFLQHLFLSDNYQLTSGSKEFIATDFPAEGVDSSSDVDDLSSLVIEDFENLRVQDGNFDRNGMQFSSLDATGIQGIRNCAAVLCSEGENPFPSTVITKTKMSTTYLSAESCILAKSFGDATLKSIPVTVPLSALQGSRAKYGMPLDQAVHVSWAPDVYDPPVSSSSHTVKGYHHRRPKGNKDHYKQKHKKDKSSKASSNDRRHSHRSSISSVIDPRIRRLHAL